MVPSVAHFVQIGLVSAAQASDNKSMFLFSILLACPVEQLGVELPKGGVQSISQEDLQRDCFGLRKEDPKVFWLHRMEQMHAGTPSEGEGWACVGEGPRWVAPWPVDTDTAAAAALLISVAKGWDGTEAAFQLCIGTPPPVEGEQRLGPMAPGPLQGLQSGTYDPSRPLEGLSYVELQTKAVAIWKLTQASLRRSSQ